MATQTEKVIEVMRAYARLEPQAQIARRLGIHRATVRAILIREGVYVPNVPGVTDETLVEVYERTKSIQRVADEVGMSQSGVAGRLRRVTFLGGPKRLDSSDLKRMTKLYRDRKKNKFTMRDIGEIFGVHPDSVRRAVRRSEARQ